MSLKQLRQLLFFRLSQRGGLTFLLIYTCLVFLVLGESFFVFPNIRHAPVQALIATTFTYTGSVQTYTVPAGVTAVTVKMWGAGGETGSTPRNSGGQVVGSGRAGGAGGYTTATIAVTPGQQLRVVVGGTNGGLGGSGNNYSTGGDGGGYSGIFNGTPSQATALALAGGGGGGGNTATGFTSPNAFGGAGGGSTGLPSGGFSMPGTQTQGGATTPFCNATNGGALAGGNGGNCPGVSSSMGSGGGGGGWYGGSGGVVGRPNYGEGGSGGSGYCKSTGVINCSLVAGSGTTPGNSTDSARPGNAGDPDNNGAVLISTASVSVSASPSSVVSGQASTITWSSQNISVPSPLPFTSVGTLPDDGFIAAPTLISLGFIYTFGGSRSSGPIDSIYRAALGSPTSWSRQSATLPSRLSDSAFFNPGDGYIYLVGGFVSSNSATPAIYRASVSDPTAWANTGSLLPQARAAYGQSGIVNGYLYIFGGSTSTSSANTIYRAPVDNPLAWSNTGATLPANISRSQLVVPGNGFIYLIGGYNGSALNTIYRASEANPLAWSLVGTLPTSLYNSTVMTPGDGYIYLLGGINGLGLPQIYRASTATPTTWTDTGSNLPALVVQQAPTFAFGGRTYLLGGYGFSFDPDLILLSAVATSPCSVSSQPGGFSTNPTGLSGSQATNPLTITQNVIATCATSDIGTITATTSVAVLPALVLAASPTTVTYGGTSNLTWSGGSATACTLTDSAVPPATLSTAITNPPGGLSTGPVTASTIYTLACTLPGGSTANTTATVTMTPAPLPTINSFSGTRARSGSASTLSWSVANMAVGIGCSITPAVPGGNPVWTSGNPWTGTAASAPITQTTTYTFACTNGVATTSRSTSVGLVPQLQEI